MASLAEVAKRLNKEFQNDKMVLKGSVVPTFERLSTGALGSDYVLFGGLPYGRLCVYSGLQHSGKTTGACCQMAAYQRANPDKMCVYVDTEHSLDKNFQAAMNGVDWDKAYYVDPIGLSGEQILDMIIELQKSDDIGMIILDSLPALVPACVLANDLTKDSGMRATMAKPLYPFCAMMADLVSRKKNIFIMINQVRDDGKTFTGIQKWKEPCGGAPQFYSSVSVRFGTRKFTLGDDMDACGAKNGEGADGVRLIYKILKNKTAPCNRGGGFLTYRYATGLDWMHDLIEVALKFDFIKRLNNVTYRLVNLETGEVYRDENGQELTAKKADLIEYIKTHPQFQDEYLGMLNRYISTGDQSYGSLLDEKDSAEIDEQEAAVTVED